MANSGSGSAIRSGSWIVSRLRRGRDGDDDDDDDDDDDGALDVEEVVAGVVAEEKEKEDESNDDASVKSAAHALNFSTSLCQCTTNVGEQTMITLSGWSAGEGTRERK